MKFRRSIITGKKTASYDFKKNSNKDIFNIKVCNSMRRQGSKSALIMDGEHMRSTRYCESIGIKKDNITSIEKNRNLHNKHLKNGIHSYLGDVWKIISQPNIDAPYDALNLDAVSSCNTVSKNIENVFKNNYLSNKSTLALTVTKRSKIKGSNCYEDYDKLKDDVQKYCTKYNFKCIIDSEHEQNKVLSIFYVVNKNN